MVVRLGRIIRSFKVFDVCNTHFGFGCHPRGRKRGSRCNPMGPRLRHTGVTFGQFPGGFSGGATPDPIPNSVVKPTRADGTSRASDWESRSLPGLFFA